MSKNNSVTVPTRAWHGDVPMELTFPESWNVVSCEMNGHSAPELYEALPTPSAPNPSGSWQRTGTKLPSSSTT